MDLDQYTPATSDDYMRGFRTTAALVNKAIDTAEKTQFVSDRERDKSLQRLAEGVETIACLRGDSGLFENGRTPDLRGYQHEMYQIEDLLRARLIKLGYVYSPR